MGGLKHLIYESDFSVYIILLLCCLVRIEVSIIQASSLTIFHMANLFHHQTKPLLC